jgi:hypothetical protein
MYGMSFGLLRDRDAVKAGAAASAAESTFGSKKARAIFTFQFYWKVSCFKSLPKRRT